MEKEQNNNNFSSMHCDRCCRKMHHNWCSKSMFGSGYGLAFIGAAIYYIQQATTFWMGVLGILKALVWPALLVYKLLGYLGM